MIIYRGPSLIDGAPIVVVATGAGGNASANVKTGPVLQTWILRADIEPMQAIRDGADASICGQCPHRSQVPGTLRKRTCYVNMIGPRGVYRALASYPTVAPADLPALGAGRVVRLGAYGDPAAVPRWVWEGLTRDAAGVTGYTHQWRLGFALADLCMASCDSEADVRDATALGYRAFYVTPTPQPRAPGFMVCPASEEAGKRLTCAECRSCGGTGSKARSHVQIAAHGPAARLVSLRTAKKNVTGAEPLTA